MKILKIGSTGPLVELLQLGLIRSGDFSVSITGNFDITTQNAVIRFQKRFGLTPDGVVGPRTQEILVPYYEGYAIHTIIPGDTYYKIAKAYGTTVAAIRTANPNIDANQLKIGSTIVVPFGFPVIPTNMSIGSTALTYFIHGLAARYPFLGVSEMGRSGMGNVLYLLDLGQGENTVFYNASHHANEWITTVLLLKFTEDLSHAYAQNTTIGGISAASIFQLARIYIAPCVNPDGVDVVIRELTSGNIYENVVAMSENYPQIPFPEGWKANISGVDLNLQYPAQWEQAKEIKFEQGYTRPGPRDFVGGTPLSESESRAMYDTTLRLDPKLILAYHTQGEVIYWKYLDYEPPLSREIAYRFGELSGYEVEETPYASGFAGYKDWFIEAYNRPGYTVEVGLGVSPVPISQFPRIYANNIGILAEGAILTA